jgi:uncharacterized protein YkwD
MITAKQTNKSFLVVVLSCIACVISVSVFLSILSYSNTIRGLSSFEIFTIEQLNIAVNKRRIEKKLKPLKLNTSLLSAAKSKATDMSSKQYFSHISPVDGTKWSDFINKSGYDYQQAGENLAHGFDDVAEMVQAWMDSPSHRENILNPEVDETGFGYQYGKLNGVSTYYVVQVFGKQSS